MTAIERRFIIHLAALSVIAAGMAALCASEAADASVDISVFTGDGLQDAPPIYDVDIDGIHYRLQTDQAFAQGFAEDGFRKDLAFPDEVTWNGSSYTFTGILPHAFEHQPIETLIIPDAALGAGDFAFNGCKELKSIKIGKNTMYVNAAFTVVEIDHKNLGAESALETIEVSPGNEHYKVVDNVLYERMVWDDTGEPFTLLRLCQPTKTGTFAFPDEVFGMPVSYIGARQFQGSHISAITIPDTVEHIQDSCFTLCNGITELTIPPSVEVIGEYQQETPFPIGWCADLKYLTISSTVIASVQVTSLPQLEYLHITDSVDLMGSNCIRTDRQNPYRITSLVIGDVDDIQNQPFQHFQFYESPGSSESLVPNAETLRNSAWWSTGSYEEGSLKMYRSVTVALDADGGLTPVGAVQAGFGGKIGKLPDAILDGKVFDGWYDAAGNRITADYVFSENTTITARYTDVKHDPVDIGVPIAATLSILGLAVAQYAVAASDRGFRNGYGRR